MISLCGAFGSGKTTLANAYADKHGIYFIPSRAGEVFKSFGFTVGQPMTSSQRLDIQDAILESWVLDVRETDGLWITDRSPMDMAGHILADLADAPDLDRKRAMAYIDRCFYEANRHCPLILLVQPGVPLVVRENRPEPNPLTQERMNAVLWGLLQDPKLHARPAYMGRHLLAMSDRLDAVENLLEHVVKASLKELSHGAAIH